MTIGVLAIQGDFEAHVRLVEELGARAGEVRTAADLTGVSGLVIPGGESTTMTLGIAREGLSEPIRAFAAAGSPILGTCAGLIMLDRDHLGVLDVRARRNAFGRQLQSFEAPVTLAALNGTGPAEVRGVFIRAPWVEEVGPGVSVLAELDGHAVAVVQQNVLAVAFHPEIAGETRLHRWLVERAA